MASGWAIAILILLIHGCHQPAQEENPSIVEQEILALEEISDQIEEYVTDEKSIFYGLSSPLEISHMFERIGAFYTPQILNPTTNANNYSSSSKIALNLGVYGVDLSFIKMFDQKQDAFDYLLTIQKLTRQLGIPDDFLNVPLKNIEKNQANTDSIIQIAVTTFAATQDYLKEQGRPSAASLIILGGWVEALYIATESLYDEENPNPEIIEKIAEQKYSLNSLISFLKNYYDDPVAVYYLRMLKVLKKYFDEFEIYFEVGDVKIDTVNQVIHVSGNRIQVSKEIILKIKNIISKVRDDIIS